MKILYTIFFCLSAVWAFYQPTKVSIVPQSDTYKLDKVDITFYDYGGQKQYYSTTIDNPALLDSTNSHQKNIFKELKMSDNILTECVLSNDIRYKVYERYYIIPLKDFDNNKDYLKDCPNGDCLSAFTRLNNFTSHLEDNTLVIDMEYTFVDGSYDKNNSLKAHLKMFLNKEQQ